MYKKKSYQRILCFSSLNSNVNWVPTKQKKELEDCDQGVGIYLVVSWVLDFGTERKTPRPLRQKAHNIISFMKV